jgi:hypothetical protein
VLYVLYALTSGVPFVPRRETKVTEGEASRVAACCVDFSLRATCPINAHVSPHPFPPLLSFPLPPSLSVVSVPSVHRDPRRPVRSRKVVSPRARSSRSVPPADSDRRGQAGLSLSTYRHTISLRTSAQIARLDVDGSGDPHLHHTAIYLSPQHGQSHLGTSTDDNELINRSQPHSQLSMYSSSPPAHLHISGYDIRLQLIEHSDIRALDGPNAATSGRDSGRVVKVIQLRSTDAS